jgi:hypothetical protein
LMNVEVPIELLVRHVHARFGLTSRRSRQQSRRRSRAQLAGAATPASSCRMEPRKKSRRPLWDFFPDLPAQTRGSGLPHAEPAMPIRPFHGPEHGTIAVMSEVLEDACKARPRSANRTSRPFSCTTDRTTPTADAFRDSAYRYNLQRSATGDHTGLMDGSGSGARASKGDAAYTTSPPVTASTDCADFFRGTEK